MTTFSFLGLGFISEDDSNFVDSAKLLDLLIRCGHSALNGIIFKLRSEFNVYVDGTPTSCQSVQASRFLCHKPILLFMCFRDRATTKAVM